MISLQQVAKHCVPELGFEPSALGRHNAAGIGYFHKVIDARRIHGKGAGVFTAVDEFLQFACAADAADKVDPRNSNILSTPSLTLAHLHTSHPYIEVYEMERWKHARCPMQAANKIAAAAA